MKLYQHQRAWLAHHITDRRAALWWATGLGKTAVACMWLKQRNNPLVVCPKGLKLNWQKELDMWGAKATVITKEEFSKYITYHPAIVVDECDHFASPQFKSGMSKHMRKYLNHHNPAVLLLSATPYRSSPWNIYTLASYIGKGWNWRWFDETFFDHVWMGRRLIPKIKPSSAPILRKLIASIGDVKTLEECVDVPEQTDEILHVSETPEQEKEKDQIQDIVPIARFTAEHRIESGGDKPDVILRLCEENKKVVVVCRYRDQIEQLTQHLAPLNKPLYAIHGGITTLGRQAVVEGVRKDDECIVLVQSATCEGYSLETIPVMVFASMDWSYRNYVQMRGRIQRINNIKKNLYIHLLCGDADKAIAKAMEKHEDFDVLKYYEKRNKV